jgi:hypothetical protein
VAKAESDRERSPAVRRALNELRLLRSREELARRQKQYYEKAVAALSPEELDQYLRIAYAQGAPAIPECPCQ